MCQGLPCVGANVRLVERVILEDRELERGILGIVEEEDLEDRRVLVYFPILRRRLWLPESAVEENLEETV